MVNTGGHEYYCENPINIEDYRVDDKIIIENQTFNLIYRYVDNNELVDNNNRACIKCGKMPTKDLHDYCIANLPGVENACCGHGIKEGYIKFNNGITIRGYFKIEHD